ncbi:MAG: PAS domain-containing protein, partial [Halanaeroarchaeum sp.]
MNSLELREEHLAQVQQIADIGSWSLDLERDVFNMSRECYRIFGLEPDEPVSLERFLEFAHPDDERDVREQWERALEGDEYDVEYRVRVGDEVRWVRVRADITVDEVGGAREAVG